jgi:hypothetical protein
MFLVALFACTQGGDPNLPTVGPPGSSDSPYNGALEHEGDRGVLYLWGTRDEIGYAEGALTCDLLGPLFKYYLLEELIGRHSDYTYALAKAFVLGSVAFEDDDLREINGFFEGANDYCTEEQLTVESDMLPDGPHRLDLDDLKFVNAVADFGCTSFTAWGDASATGETLAGRNFDWAMDPEGMFSADHMLKVYDSTEEGARFASVMVPGLQGCVSCLTDEGLLLTMHNATGLTPDQRVGISPRMLSARAALVATVGAADPVDAADAVLDSRPQVTGNNLHLAMPMARGGGEGGVVFEVDGQGSNADGQSTVRRAGEDSQEPRTDVTLAANHYAKRRIDLGDDDSNGRVATLAAAIDLGPVSVADAPALLESVENGYDGVTTHSVIWDVSTRELQLFVAPDIDTPALEATPTLFDMDQVWAHLGELSGDRGV